MRWRVLLACSCLWATSAFAAVVPNAGFEQPDADGGNGPANWSADQWGDVKATFTWTMDGHTGRGARIDVTTAGAEGDAKWWGADFGVDGKSKTYQLGDWFRANVPSTILVWVRFTSGAEGYYTVAQLPPSASWAHVNTSYSIPEGAQRLRVLHIISEVGHLEIDDVFCEGKEDTNPVGPAKYKATVSFTFDDGWLSAYNMLIPRLDKKGWKGTHFIITTYPDKPGYQSDYILSKHVKSLMDRCHEVASHTLTHPDLAALPTAEWTAEITEPIKTLKGWGSGALGIAPPYGSYTNEIRSAISAKYQYMRTLHPDINEPPYNVQELNGHVLTNTSTNAELEELLTRAEQVDGGWVILVFHRASPEAPSDAHVRPEQFQGFLDLVEKHGAKVEPIGTHLGIYKCTPLPEQPTVVVGDKMLDPPAEATRASQDAAGTAPATGCQTGGRASGTLPILAAALGLLWQRRRMHRNVRPR